MSTNEEKVLIEACLKGDRQAQFRLYDVFAPRMTAVCRRYARTSWDMDDILQEGFIKAFRYLKDFRNDGSFEGWLRRIMVTTAYNFYKRTRFTFTETELGHMPDEAVSEMSVTAGLFYNELMRTVNSLPNGYQQVFRLNAIEGHTHKEIGQLLGISVNTSKSQLTRAKDQLQRKITVNDLKLNILQTA